MEKAITFLILILLLFGNYNLAISQANSHHKQTEQKWNNAGFKNTKVTNFDTDDFYYGYEVFTHVMELTVVNLRGSGWDEQLIKKTISRAAEVYVQCGIKIKNLTYIEADPPYDRVDISEEKNQDGALAKLLPISSRPVVFFIRSQIEGKTGFAWPKEFADPPIQNTAFITSEVNTFEYREKREKGYSPTAHEIAHLLGNCEHIEGEEYNILSKYFNRVSSNITDEQCSTFKSFGVENGLLQKL